jgi:hypothetical protein
MLTAEDQESWERYLELERKGQRRAALALLTDLVASVRSYPEAQRTRWLASLCERIVDQGERIPVRHPLMAGLVAPFLIQWNPSIPTSKVRRRSGTVWNSGCVTSLHELPAGVLYGMNGATQEECQLLLKDLARFEALARALGRLEQEAARIARWRRHFAGYADYLALRPKYRRYEEYLDSHFPGWRTPGA